MSQNPPFFGQTPPTGAPYPPSPMYMPPPRTSGFAIAALILGILGLPSCCLPLLSGLALVLGIFALPAIHRREAGGRGMAIAGIVLGILGLLLGAGFWVIFYMSPKTIVLSQKHAKDRTVELRTRGILDDGEELSIIALTHTTTGDYGGLALTDKRFVEFNANGVVKSCDLDDVRDVKSTSTFSSTKFELIMKDGSSVEFDLEALAPMVVPFRQELEKQVRKGGVSATQSAPAEQEPRPRRSKR